MSVDEVIFIEKGSIDIGFVLNDISKNVVRLREGGVIGVFNVTFNIKTRFKYTCSSYHADLYGINKPDWQRIMGISGHCDNDYSEVTETVKLNVKNQYNWKIFFPLMKA